MKISSAQWGSVLRELGRYAGVLLHGDDAGLVRDRALAAARSIAANSDDPFLSAVLAKEEHGRLLEEAQSQSMVGGRRVVRVQDAADALTPVLSRLQDSSGALVIMEANSLTPRSKLRQAAEKSAAWASLACYPEEGSALKSSIRRVASSAGYTLSDDAAEFLTRELAGDTNTRLSELEKLFLYAGPSRTIDLEMALLCGTHSSEAPVALLLGSVMAGDIATSSRLIRQMEDEPVTGPALIAALNARLQRTLRVCLDIQSGRTAEEAVRALMPPIFFRDVARAVREAENWRESSLRAALTETRMADIACKRAGSRDLTIASQLYLTVSRRAARAGGL